MSRFKEYLEIAWSTLRDQRRADFFSSKKEDNNLSLDKKFLVVRKIRDYDDVITIPTISFDTEEEAQKWIDYEYDYQSMKDNDTYEIREQ